MRRTSEGSYQLQTIFGGGYVPEQRGDETHSYLPTSETGEFGINFDYVLKVLRAALSLR
jgi:hypothetical protein